MTNLTDLTGLAGIASAISAMALWLPDTSRLSSRLHGRLVSGIVFVLVLIPIGGMPIAAYVRGVTGDLSITALVLLWGALLKPWIIEAKASSRLALLILIALAALALYPMALGVGSFDPYRPGYGEPLFVAALMLIALAGWLWESTLITLCIAFAALAWATGWYESGNLWDYLLDPFVAFYAIFALTIHAVKMLMSKSIRLKG